MNLIKNGFILLNLYYPLYLLFNNHLITTTIILKLLHINYYYYFGHLSPKLNHTTKLIRPWVRLTDTGFYALIVYYFYNEFFPICFNIHFVISIAYWIIMIIFGFQDSDNIHSHELSIYIAQFISSITHGLPLLLLSKDICTNNVYFNVMVWGEPGLTNSLVLFQLQEDENADGNFTSASEDMYSVQINVNWVGWKLVSVKYSDLQCLVNGSPAAPSGNGVHESDKLMQINMLHLANPNSGYAKSKLDYIIFTENGPLNP